MKCDERLQTRKTGSGRRCLKPVDPGAMRSTTGSTFRYWFVDWEVLELAVRRHEMLEYGGEQFGTKLGFDPISTYYLLRFRTVLPF